MITRILIAKKDGRFFYQKDRGPVTTHFGSIAAADINDALDGALVKSNRNEQCIVLTPQWLDYYKKLTRGPQIMLLKDLGVIAAETGVGPDSIIGDAGTGTGAAAIYFARHCKHVFSYDIVKEHAELGMRNADALGITNVTFAVHNVYESIPDHGFDLFVLDNPEPHRALDHLASIKIGGFVVAYMPSINQAATFANAVQEHEGLLYVKTVELMEREWAVKGLRVRPSSDAIGHTGFLVFARRIR